MPVIIISAKTFKINKAQKDYVTKQLNKAARFSSAPIKEMKAELDHDKNQRTGIVFRVELSVQLPGKVIKAGQKAKHMREAIDLCVPKLIRQIKKYKGKVGKTKHPGQASIRKQ